jgi:hypothetical protein
MGRKDEGGRRNYEAEKTEAGGGGDAKFRSQESGFNPETEQQFGSFRIKDRKITDRKIEDGTAIRTVLFERAKN